MPAIAIQPPAVEAGQQIEVEVKINGAEAPVVLPRRDARLGAACGAPPAERAYCPQRLLAQHEKNWQLIKSVRRRKRTFR